METVSILAVALGVGVVVYALSLGGASPEDRTTPIEPHRPAVGWLRGHRARRTGRELGFGDDGLAANEPEPAAEGFVYVPVLASDGPRWRTRIGGVIGLIALVAIGAAVLALGAYQLGHVVNDLVAGFLGS